MAEIRTYKPGDTIRIALKVRDESGVSHVSAIFVHREESTKQIHLGSSGRDKPDTEVILETQVTESMAPGEYYCIQLNLEDSVGNRSLVSRPGIRFKIADVPGDHEGPTFEHWRYA